MTPSLIVPFALLSMFLSPLCFLIEKALGQAVELPPELRPREWEAQ